ncbi:hypothetical protein [Serratia fonticola]|uniref:Uncharacterized protein n=1 Tax=Serratia fonticola TaxID=47917 RepID=A0AAW3WZA1_SERFO|nr:hypothetical protein [Serratia fonticola]ERK08377.1 hypothetical protein L580_1765 [Serratia fonticola AU-P3(3)]MBC3215816.1 hypothetical protein [Serratia fonticola]MEB7885996.1 hypothetical protein [Serratia fonticola]NYA16088.1 hypothetical protein [Serratia fonticola]NYA36251.1 hypothetical protein [Serratia fonticola]
MTHQHTGGELTEAQKQEIDLIALQRVEAMNSDEFLCQRIDEKVHAMEEHLKAYFNRCFSLHLNNKHSEK